MFKIYNVLLGWVVRSFTLQTVRVADVVAILLVELVICDPAK
jgi:hypothetical protein